MPSDNPAAATGADAPDAIEDAIQAQTSNILASRIGNQAIALARAEAVAQVTQQRLAMVSRDLSTLQVKADQAEGKASKRTATNEPAAD